MKKSILLIMIFAICTCTYAQISNKTFVDNFYDAFAYMYEDNYDAALISWQKAENADANNPNVWYNLGVCYKNTAKDREMAVVYLEKALEHIAIDYVAGNHKIRTVPLEAYLDYGSSLRMLGRFDEAITAFEKAKELGENNNKTELIANAEAEIIVTKNAKLSAENNVCRMISVTNIGETVNSENSDHSPNIVCDGKTLYFTSKRSNLLCPEGCEKIYVTHKTDEGWSSPDMLPAPINNNGKNESVVSVSADGREMYFFRSAKGIQGSIYYTKLDEDDKWTKPQLLSSDVNSKYRETHATMAPDGKTMYFTSDRPGGFGGLDIYVIKKEGEKWSKPQLLPAEVNTIRDEECPFVHPNGSILYFSSKGHQSLGGFDVFYSRINEDGTYSKAESMCSPINTPDNDVSYTLSCDGLTAYVAAIRKDSNGEYDIYEIKEIDDDAVIIAYEGKVEYADKKHPKDAKIWVKAKTSGETLGSFDVDSKTGKYECSLLPNVEYELTLAINDKNLKSFTKKPSIEEAAKFKKTQVALPLDKIELPYFNKSISIFVTDTEILSTSTTQTLDEIIDDYAYLSTENRNLNICFMFNKEELPKKSEEITTITNYLKERGVEAKNISLNKTPKNSNIYNVDVKYSKEVLADNQAKQEEVEPAKQPAEENPTPQAEQPTKTEQPSQPVQTEQPITPSSTETQQPSKQQGNMPEQQPTQQPTEQNLANAPFASEKEAEQIINPNFNDTLEVNTVYFDFDKWDVAEEYKQNLNELARYMVENPESQIELGGHTDYVGTSEYNYLLSGRRAKSVKDYLVAKGVKQDKIITVKYGETKPSASNNTSATRKFNRRVDFKVITQGNDRYLKITDNNMQTATAGTKYYIQLVALRNYKEPSSLGLNNVKVEKQSNGMYKYYLGYFETKTEAETLLQNVISSFPSAIIMQR